MPYQKGPHHNGERASKLGHLEVLNSVFVQSVIESFEKTEDMQSDESGIKWQKIDESISKLTYVFAVDGSIQTLSGRGQNPKEVAFVKTALFYMDPMAIEKIDLKYPHPAAMKKLMANSASFHATVFPLNNVKIAGSSWQEGVRKLIFDSFKDPTIDGEPYETLKWIIYEKWQPEKMSRSPGFECPYCYSELDGLAYNMDEDDCPRCHNKIFVTDVLGFHMEMSEDSARDSLAKAYMLMHENIMLFTAIRYFWEQQNYKVLCDTLFLKDGPLSLRGQYSKIIPNIRCFLSYANSKGYPIHICGQEKTGHFVDYLATIQRFALPEVPGDPLSYSVLSHKFVRKQVQRIQQAKYPYGYKTNYGEKAFVKLSPYHAIVISVPTGEFIEVEDFPSSAKDYIGLDRILATLPNLVSYRYESALIPIELANGIASLSSYPSAKILGLFAKL